MAVYVDPPFRMVSRNAQARRVGARHDHRWSHLFADEEDELHEMARKIGLKSAINCPRHGCPHTTPFVRNAEVRESSGNTARSASRTATPLTGNSTAPNSPSRPNSDSGTTALQPSPLMAGSARAAEKIDTNFSPSTTSTVAEPNTAENYSKGVMPGVTSSASGSLVKTTLKVFEFCATTATWRVVYTGSVPTPKPCNCWFDADKDGGHYDLVPVRRAKAVALGAIEVDRQTAVAIWRRNRVKRWLRTPGLGPVVLAVLVMWKDEP